jgi:signal peptidase I
MVSARPAVEHPRPESIKETIEQILIAFVLAFIFRCFVVEAFVIPTGSMATTLLGQHIDLRCPDCGHHFKVDYQPYGSTGGSAGDSFARVPMRDGSFQPRALPLRCDNCSFKLPLQLPDDPDNDAVGPPVRGGDRILVDKITYLFEAPQRWDVVVFKSPYYNERIPPPGEPSPPGAYHENYIKRLVGKPGETIMILDGDIYASTADKPVASLTPADFTIQTKPWRVQQALWRIVYDNDHLPRGLDRVYTDARGARFAEQPWRQPWVSDAAGWDTSGRTFVFDGSGPATLRFDRSAMPDRFPLTDWIAYAVTKSLRGDPSPDLFRDPGYDPARDPLNDVSDVMLALTYRRQSGDGPLRLSVSKAGTVFVAEFTPSGVRLVRRDESAEREIGSVSRSGIGRGAGTRIELVNCDHRVSVRLDGREVLATTPEDFSPDIAGLIDRFHRRPGAPVHPPTEVTIEASAQSAQVAHVSLWRDIYYLNRLNDTLGGFVWGSPLDFPLGRGEYSLMRLGRDEYFTLGDNSIMSLDGRGWTAPIVLPDENLFVDAGRVPDRFLIGKAFFVYWPAGFRAFDGFPQLLPNFGEMRAIE